MVIFHSYVSLPEGNKGATPPLPSLACSSRLLLCQLVAEPDIASSGRYGLRLAPNRENGRRECQIECQSI